METETFDADVAIRKDNRWLKGVVLTRDMTGGWFVPALAGAPPIVRLSRRWSLPIDVVVENETQGRKLLRAIGMDASQSVARFRTRAEDVTNRWVAAVLAAALVVLLTMLIAPRGRLERIRVAADTIAQPKLRVAVEAASKDDEAALLSALDGLDEDRPRTAVR
jgi:hypothetical protein